MTRVHSCLVDGCSSTSLTSHLCRWPRSVELERVWIDLLKSHSSRLTSTLTHRNRIHRHAYVCHLHFEEKFIKNDHARVPLSWPTLFSEEEISSRRPTRPVTVFRPVGDHSYAVAPWTNVELVPQKRKWAKSHIELASNVKTLYHDHNYVHNPNKTIKLASCSQDESGLQMPDISPVVTTPAAALSKAAMITHQETPLILLEKNDDQLQLIEETQVDSNFEYIIEADEEGPFSWQKSIVVPCDEEIVGSELSSQLIDDDVLLYDSEPHYSHAAQDIFAEETEEVLEELKCNLCENIIKGGFRYSCVQCPDFDLCGACEAKGAHRMHYVLRSPGTKDVSEVQLMLRRIRQTLLTDSVVSLRDHPGGLTDEVKEEFEEGPESGSEEHDPLSGDVDPAEATLQELSLDECSDTGATESEEDEPPQKRPALSPFEFLDTPYTFTLESKLISTAQENQILLEIEPQEIRENYVPVPDGTKQMPMNLPMGPLTYKYIPKETCLLLAGSSQQGHNSDTPVSVHTVTGKRVLLPITPSNVIDQENTNKLGNFIGSKTIPSVRKEDKLVQLRTMNPSVRIERLDVHTLNKYRRVRQTRIDAPS